MYEPNPGRGHLVRGLRRALWLACAMPMLWIAPPAVAAEDAAPAAQLTELQQQAVQRHPGLRAAYEQWRAAEAQQRGEGALPDPVFSYGAIFMDDAMASPPQAHRLGIEQMFPWFGVRGQRSEVARSEAAVARARFEDLALEVRLEVAVAVHELVLLTRSIEITQDNLDLLVQFEKIALARYRVGAVENADLLRLQVEMGMLEDRVRRLRDLLVPARARLNALLDQPVDAPLPAAFVLEASAGALAPADSLRAALLRDHPRLRALEAEAELEGHETTLARKEGFPDLMLGVMRTFGSDEEPMLSEETMATVSFNLPLWRGKIRSRVDAAQGRRSAVLAMQRSEENELLVELQEALFEHEDARRRVELYRDTLLPKASESLNASLAGYEVGRTDFSALIDTERMLLEFRLMLSEAEIDVANARARIARLVPTGSEVSIPNQESDR